MAKRYSGRATVTIRLTPRDEYIANVSVGGRNVYTLVTLPPPGSRLAIGSPAAYDDVARAALSFWADEGGPAEGTFEWGGSGPYITRTKPRASRANGRRRVGAKRRTRRNTASGYTIEIANRVRNGRVVGIDYVVTQRGIGRTGILARRGTRAEAEDWIAEHDRPTKRNGRKATARRKAPKRRAVSRKRRPTTRRRRR